jgi:glycosyltransferase involved in cell wall biosynthesis
MSTAPRVSVIVAVYNPGEYLEGLVESLLAQSLRPGEFEVIFVDDGSTDGANVRLDELASLHPHIQAIHIPNSGWPGRPRNLGIDAARGRYVYFVDHDDWLAPEALERLADRADRTDADVVLGKEVGHGGFGVPLVQFARNVDDAPLRASSARSAARSGPSLTDVSPVQYVPSLRCLRATFRIPSMALWRTNCPSTTGKGRRHQWHLSCTPLTRSSIGSCSA